MPKIHQTQQPYQDASAVAVFDESLTTLPMPTDNLQELIETLQAIDIDAPLAKLNETTITDNNGGRIEL